MRELNPKGIEKAMARASILTENPMQPDPTAQTHLPRQVLTFKFRLRDRHASELNRQARAVNFVWNYVNEVQQKTVRAHRKWLSAFDLQKLTNGASKYLDLHAHTIQRVCRAYDDARKTHKKAWLKWRSKKSLGWVPFNAGHVTADERYTTQSCSVCGAIGGPKGLKGLQIRVWACECGAVHDRDVNSARLILRRGLATLVEGARP